LGRDAKASERLSAIGRKQSRQQQPGIAFADDRRVRAVKRQLPVLLSFQTQFEERQC
jgi:hypothetical protein